MSRLCLRVTFLAALLAAACAAQPTKPPAKSGASATGVLLGRSGKPLANARVFLGKLQDDEEMLQAKIGFAGLPISHTDATGHFQLAGFNPGNYTIVYFPSGSSSIAPAEFSIKAIQAVTRSILPGMKGVEIGTTQTLDERKWGSIFTLLKGHTFWGDGANMKIWNATVRRGPTGPFLEVRKGSIWQSDFADKGQVKLEAWSF
jgi:hypothetical protein